MKLAYTSREINLLRSILKLQNDKNNETREIRFTYV